MVIYALMAACSSRTPTERERALERIGAEAHVIAAADGASLSSPPFRSVLDAVKSHIPATLSCVIDAALTSEAVAASVQIDVGTTIVIVTRATVATCPALSKLDDHVYAATIGAGVLAESRARSILADARWDRARPYVLREPFALAAELPSHRAIAVAQPDPLDAWLTIDSADLAATEDSVQKRIGRYHGPSNAELAGTLAVDKVGTQLRVHAVGLVATDLTTIVLDLVKDAVGSATSPLAAFTCPTPLTGVISCHDGTHFKVASVEKLLKELAAIDATPVIAGGDIIGIRLLGDPPRVLRRDDVILGLDAHRIADARQLRDLASTFDRSAALAVRRGRFEAVFELSE